MLNSSRDKNEGTYRSGEGGGGRTARCVTVTPDLSFTTGRERERNARIINGMKKKKKMLLVNALSIAKSQDVCATGTQAAAVFLFL